MLTERLSAVASTTRSGSAERQQQLVVAAKQLVANDIVAIELRSPDGSRLPAWQPGAHIELRFETAGAQLRRQYSLCGDPDGPVWRIAVLREQAGRGGSAYLHDAVNVGDVLSFDGPRNHFELKPSNHYLFVAGGIGITPILPMVRSVAGRGESWELVYCARTEDRVAFADDLTAFPSENVTIHIDERDGLLDIDQIVAGRDSDTSVYACGPVGLLHAVESRADAATWRYYFEQFVPNEPVDPSTNRAFEVVLGSTNVRYLVVPDVSILDVLNAHGHEIPFSCHEGTCGTCETGVLEGIPDHRDSVLSREEQAENDCMMLCVSRAKTPHIVLDL